MTVCTHRMSCLFGTVVGGQMQRNGAGDMVADALRATTRLVEATLDEYVVMPDHLHFIVVLPGTDASLPDVVPRYKTWTTRRYRAGVASSGWRPYSRHLWQRGYYDRVIRSDTELDALRDYIRDNPARWHHDRYYR